MRDVSLEKIQINFARLKNSLSMKVALQGLTEAVPRRLFHEVHKYLEESDGRGQVSLEHRIEEVLAQHRDARSGIYTQQKELIYLLAVLERLDGSVRAQSALQPSIQNRYRALTDPHVRRMVGREIEKLLMDHRPNIRAAVARIRDDVVSAREVKLLDDFSTPFEVRDEIVRRMIEREQLMEFLPQLEAYLHQVVDRNANSHECAADFRALDAERLAKIGRVLAEQKGEQNYMVRLFGSFFNGALTCEPPWLTLAMQFGDVALRHIIDAREREGNRMSLEALQAVWPFVLEHAKRNNRRAVDFVATIAREPSHFGRDAMRKLVQFNVRPDLTAHLDGKLAELRTWYDTHGMKDRRDELDRLGRPQIEELTPLVDRQLNEGVMETVAFQRMARNRQVTLQIYLRRFKEGLTIEQVCRAVPFVRQELKELKARVKFQSPMHIREWGSALIASLVALLSENDPDSSFPSDTARQIVLTLVELRITLDGLVEQEILNDLAERHGEFQQFLRTHWSYLFKTPGTIGRRKRDHGA